MSLDPVVLGCLARICRVELQMFEKVAVGQGQEGSSCYLCIAKHGLFFVSREMDRLIDGFTTMLSYLDIERAVTDSSTRRLFLLELVSEWDSSWDGSGRILVESQHREALLERVGLCWQAEYMYRNFEVRKFQLAKATIGTLLPAAKMMSKNSIDNIMVKPFNGYEDHFTHRGYGFFLRKDFKSPPRQKTGTFSNELGWEIEYNSQKLVVPPGVEITVQVNEPMSMMELESSASGMDDLRTVATQYKQALTDHLDQFYVLVNGPYMKRMNRANDLAAWDGWEFFIRSKEYAFACVLFRREYIPPLCDVCQDLAVLLRCPAEHLNYDMCEVMLDECRFVADSLASTSDAKPYYDIIQARLDTLQFTEEGYRWVEGQLKMTPCHRRPAATKFVLSIVKLLENDGFPLVDGLSKDDVFKEIPHLNDPLLVPQEMLSDAELLLGAEGDGKWTREERRNAWHWRISRYLTYCVDGGIMRERFTMATLVQAVGKGSYETDKVLKTVIEFLLHVAPRGDWSQSMSTARVQLSQLLNNPEEFGKYSFNEKIMRLLLIENYIQNEWKRKNSDRDKGASYEKLLSCLLDSQSVGFGLRTLICRQILETTNTKDSAALTEGAVHVLVPVLVRVMQGDNLSLTSCATAALVNLSCDKMSTKTLLVSEGVLKLCTKQLKRKDDDLTLYTLFLLVNLTKTPHHRSIVVREGCVPVLVDILTSSYQNLRKQKILTEVASVIGQLCNESETRSLISNDFPVVPCLLWVYDSAQPNTKLKSKLLFALRQLSVLGQNKLAVGKHVIPTVIEELGMAKPSHEECATNAILLLTMLASVTSNALMMTHEDRINDSLEYSGIQQDGQEPKNSKFGPYLWDRVVAMKERIKQAVHISGDLP